MGGFQFAEKIADVLARVDFIVFAALDHRVHEGVVHRRALASDIAGIAEVHLEFPYALLADIVRHLDISDFKYTFHRWSFGPCISHGFFQQFTTSGIIRQSIVGVVYQLFGISLVQVILICPNDIRPTDRWITAVFY